MAGSGKAHLRDDALLRRYGLESTVRASLAFYNVREDIDSLVSALKRLQATSV